MVGGELLLFRGEEGEDGRGDVRAVGGFELEVAGIGFADGGIGEVIDHAVALGAVVSGEGGFLIRGEVEFAAETVHFFLEFGGGGFFGVFASGFEGGETVFGGETLEERDGGGGGGGGAGGGGCCVLRAGTDGAGFGGWGSGGEGWGGGWWVERLDERDGETGDGEKCGGGGDGFGFHEREEDGAGEKDDGGV